MPDLGIDREPTSCFDVGLAHAGDAIADGTVTSEELKAQLVGVLDAIIAAVAAKVS